MKNIFFLLALSFSAASAQERTKTALNNFISKPTIEWAAYINDTATLPKLNALLIGNFEKGKIKGYRPAENGITAENRPELLSITELKRQFPNDTMMVVDSNGNETMKVVSNSPGLMKEFENSVIEFYRIVYLENGKLNSYITRVSPKREVTLPSGTYIGLVEAVSFALNPKYNTAAGPKDNLIYLGTTEKTINVDSFPFYDRIKETYGRNIIAAIWPYIESGRITVYGAANKQKINNANFISGDFPGGESMQVPVYNDNGDRVGSRTLYQPAKPSDFDRITLTQKWYYNETKNIMSCTITEATIHPRAEPEKPGLSFRLVF